MGKTIELVAPYGSREPDKHYRVWQLLLQHIHTQNLFFLYTDAINFMNKEKYETLMPKNSGTRDCDDIFEECLSRAFVAGDYSLGGDPRIFSTRENQMFPWNALEIKGKEDPISFELTAAKFCRSQQICRRGCDLSPVL